MGRSDDLLYELEEWEQHERDALERALDEAGIEHAWVDATLVVRAQDESAVEQIIDEVDAELDLALDPDADKVAYDLGAWPDDRLAALAMALEDHSIPHGWDGIELTVHEEDEQVVDELIDRVASGDDPTTSSDAELDGVGAELLGELFVAADRLVHDPQEHEGTLALVDAWRLADGAAPPYGIDARQWATISEAVGELLALVDREPIDPDAVLEAATRVRDLLRPIV